MIFLTYSSSLFFRLSWQALWKGKYGSVFFSHYWCVSNCERRKWLSTSTWHFRYFGSCLFSSQVTRQRLKSKACLIKKFPSSINSSQFFCILNIVWSVIFLFHFFVITVIGVVYSKYSNYTFLSTVFTLLLQQ